MEENSQSNLMITRVESSLLQSDATQKVNAKFEFDSMSFLQGTHLK